MNIIFRKKDSNYTTISNVFLRDKKLSLKSKGFLAVVMGLPEEWDFSINGICAILKEGKSSIYSIISELKENGYCSIKACRTEKGKFMGNDYMFYEEPHTENPHTENPHTENQPQLNKDIINNLDELNKEGIKEDTNVSKKVLFYPTEEEKSVFEEFRKKYPGAKRGLKTELDLLVKKHKDWHDVIPILNKAIDAENRKRKEAKDADSFYPNPKNLQTYINNRSWELFTDEPDYDENEYHPNTNGSDVRWNEPSQRYICFYPWAFDNLCDGYTKDTRPDNATVFCQGRKYVWNKEQQKWDHD